MSGPRLVTGHEDDRPSRTNPTLVTEAVEPSFADETPIDQFPQVTRKTPFTGRGGSVPSFSPEEMDISNRMIGQIPSQVGGALELSPALVAEGMRLAPRMAPVIASKASGRLVAAAYLAMKSPEDIVDIVHGVPTVAQLQMRKARLVSDPAFLQSEIDRITSDRRHAAATSRSGIPFIPATQDDVFKELDTRLAHQIGEEASARQSRDIGNSLLSHTPQTSRMAAAANVGRNILSLVGPQAPFVFWLQVANDLRNFIRLSLDPNATAEETADKGMQFAQGTVILHGLGSAIAERAALAADEQSHIENAQSNIDAQGVAAQISRMRQAAEYNVPKPVIQLDAPRANLIATLREAHQNVAPDGVVVIAGVDNPMEMLRPNPAVRGVMAERMAYHNKSKTVYLFGDNNPNNTPENRASIQRTGFYPGQRVSYAGRDFAFVGELGKGMVRIQEVGTPKVEGFGDPKSVIDDISRSGFRNPINPREIVLNESSAVELRSREGALDINSIRAFDPKKGEGTKVMNRIVELADKYGVRLSLQPVPFGEGRKISKKKLIEWYQRFGFTSDTRYPVKNYAMVREPIVRTETPTQHSVRTKDLRLSGTNDNLTLSSVSQDAAFRLYEQLKKTQPANLGPREVDALISSMGELLALPKAQYGALREYILARESQGPRITPEMNTQVDEMLKNVLSPEELVDALREGNILANQPKGEETGDIEIPEFIKSQGRRITAPIYSIVNPDALPLEARKKYESLQKTIENVEFEREELKGTQVVDDSGKPLTVYHGSSVVRDQPVGHPREAFSREQTGPENLYGQGAAYTTEAPVVAGGLGPKDVKGIEQEINEIDSARAKIGEHGYIDNPEVGNKIIELATQIARKGIAPGGIRRKFVDVAIANNYILDYMVELRRQLQDIRTLGYATPKDDGSREISEAHLRGLELQAYERNYPDRIEDIIVNDNGKIRPIDPETESNLNTNHGKYVIMIRDSAGRLMNIHQIKNLDAFIESTRQITSSPQVIPMKLNIRNAFDIDAKYTSTEIADIIDAAEKYLKSIPDQYTFSESRQKEIIQTLDKKLYTSGDEYSGETIWRTLRSEVPFSESANNILETAGYDGITHIGGGRAGRGKLSHRVWIPFRESQIFSPFTPAPEAFRQMQQNILAEHTLDNIAASNNLKVNQVGEGYDVLGPDGELIRHITSPEQAADFINQIQQPSGPELVPELNVPPAIIPPDVKKMISSNNDGPFVPYKVLPHTLTERIVTNLRRQIFEGAIRQAKDISVMTNGAVDLESMMREMQDGARLTDALVRHEEVKAGIDKMQSRERTLTRQERDDTFRANETLSIKEAEDLAGSLGTKYADMLMGLHEDARPLDIRRLIEFTRFADELVDTSKEEKWPKDRLTAEFNKLLDYYNFTSNNQVAIPIVEAIRKQSKSKIDLHNVARLIDARMAPQEAASRDEFMTKKKFNGIQREIADNTKKVLAYFANYNGLDSVQQIIQYMAHYRSQPRLLDEHQIPRRRSSEEVPPSIHTIEEMIRSGELGVYDTSPSRMLQRYIRSSVMNKHFKPLYDLQLAEMNKRISEIADNDVRKLAKRNLNYFTEGILRNLDIEDRVHNKLFKTIANELANSKYIPKGIKKSLLNVSDRAITNLVNTSIYNMISAYQGGKIGNVPRDAFNALQMANTWFGPRFALEMLNRSFGDVKVDANGFHVTTTDRIKRGHSLGIIGQEFLKRKPPIPKDHRNPVIAMGELYNTFAHAAISLSGQQPTHDLLSLGSYEVGRDNALRTIERLRVEKDLTPDKKTKILDDELSLDMMSPEFQARFDKLLKSGTESDITSAADIYGREVVNKIMPPYGYGEQPRGWRTVPGRLFGLYGRYQIHILDQLHDMASYGRTNARSRAALERFVGSEVLRSTVSRALGVDSQNWSALGLWQGSPQYQFASDIITAIRNEDKNKLAIALEKIGASQIPLSSLVTIWNSSSSSEEALMKILTLIKPAKE